MTWWVNTHFAEGPGIAKDTPPATGLRLFGQTLAREWWGLILLNLIFLAVALPLVTLPAALVAMLHVTGLMAEDEPCEPWRDFRETFVAVFWRATAGGVMIAAVITIGCVAIVTYAHAAWTSLAYAVPLAVALTVTVLALIFALFFCQQMANHRAPLSMLAKAAGYATLLSPLPVLGALTANLALWLLHVAAYPSSILLAVTINFSLGALIVSFATRRPARTAFIHTTRPIETTQQKQFPAGPNPGV